MEYSMTQNKNFKEQADELLVVNTKMPWVRFRLDTLIEAGEYFLKVIKDCEVENRCIHIKEEIQESIAKIKRTVK